MVYDEGFEINLGEKDTSEFSSYFNFLKFSLNDKTKELINKGKIIFVSLFVNPGNKNKII